MSAGMTRSASPAGGVRAVVRTVAPPAASRSTVALPMPVEAPVTRTASGDWAMVHDVPVVELLLNQSQLDWQNSRPGFAALVVVGLLVVAVALLFRSFLKHERKARNPGMTNRRSPRRSRVQPA